jgi:hypothetical protein
MGPERVVDMKIMEGLKRGDTTYDENIVFHIRPWIGVAEGRAKRSCDHWVQVVTRSTLVGTRCPQKKLTVD